MVQWRDGWDGFGVMLEFGGVKNGGLFQSTIEFID